MSRRSFLLASASTGPRMCEARTQSSLRPRSFTTFGRTANSRQMTAAKASVVLPVAGATPPLALLTLRQKSLLGHGFADRSYLRSHEPGDFIAPVGLQAP